MLNLMKSERVETGNDEATDAASDERGNLKRMKSQMQLYLSEEASSPQQV